MRRDASRNHEAILTAAIEVLAAAPDASMGDIATASGTGRTTLYRHFPDRTALLAAAHDRVIADAEDITGRILAGGGDAIEVVADLSVELAGLGDRYRFLEGQEPEVRPEDREDNALSRYLQTAQEEGAVRDDLEAGWLYEVLVALITVAARFPDPVGDRRRQLRATVVDVLRGS